MVIIRADDQDIQNKREDNKPYAIKLLSVLQSLLFYPNFTINANTKDIFWAQCMGS